MSSGRRSESVRINRSSRRIEKPQPSSGVPIPIQGSLTIPPGKENLEIGTPAPCLSTRNRFDSAKKLEGTRSDWIDAGPRRTGYYSHLPPGTYEIR